MYEDINVDKDKLGWKGGWSFVDACTAKEDIVRHDAHSLLQGRPHVVLRQVGRLEVENLAFSITTTRKYVDVVTVK